MSRYKNLQHFILIQNHILVTLLGQKSLAVGGEGLIDGFAGDDGVEMRHRAI